MAARKHFGFAVFAVIGALGALFVSGCRYGSHGEDDARVRLINAVPDGGGLNVSVEGRRVWKRSQYRSSTGYQGISAGTYPVRMEAADLGTTLAIHPLSFQKGRAYTVLALGQVHGAGRPAAVEIPEDEQGKDVQPGKAMVRFVNAGLGLEPVDLVINNIVGLKAVAYGKRSPVLALDGGRYDLKIAAAEMPESLTSPVSLRLEPGHVYTLVAMGRASDQSLSLEAYPDAP